MANTSVVYARIDSNLKESAESILAQLGITASGAIQMFYKQIILHNGIPFELRLSGARPTAIGGMNEEQISAELSKGMDSMKSRQAYSADEVDEILAKEFGV